ncbi:hypothetical protein [Methylomonas sp. MgM2]
MNPDFSEFSYGYAVTEELVASLKASVVAAPVFPSLYEEGKDGGGYDLKIPLEGKPIFLQFKLSDYLERTNSKEHRDGVLTVPYYRMHLRPTKHSDQHNLLLDLETLGESVFYIAPEFHLPSELNSFYLLNQVVENSAAFSPKDIGPLPDDDEHYVVFQRGSTIGFRCSNEPVKIKKTPLKDGIIHLLKKRDIQTRQFDDDGLRTIIDRMLNVLSNGDERLKRRKKSVDIEGLIRITSNRPSIASIRYIARTFFDAELLIFPSQIT